jgi:exosome complex component RRP4
VKEIIFPGDVINENMKPGFGTYKKNGKIYSKYLGILYKDDGIKVIPMSGKYVPKDGDNIIGVVLEEDNFVYLLDINSYKQGVLFKRTTSAKLHEAYLLRVNSVNEIRDVEIEIVSKLANGEAIKVNPKKVARLIGKNKSMQTLIETKTNTKLIIGLNGIVYVIGNNVDKVKEIIKFIEDYSHEDNLTNKVSGVLDKMNIKK